MMREPLTESPLVSPESLLLPPDVHRPQTILQDWAVAGCDSSELPRDAPAGAPVKAGTKAQNCEFAGEWCTRAHQIA